YAAFLLNSKNYPGLIQNTSYEIEGYLIHLNQEQEKIIDLFEADFYEKKNLLVDLNNQKVECNAYLIPEKHFKLLSNKPWDPQEFREKHLASYIDMCRDFRNNEIPSLVANTL
ncbi:MAG: gamma-glutamylcyclotransferase, partial [Bdellovibrionales bacterium]|nr:gamma-glutamylcyclotransferase [Bdellovibrionales bacterium]